MPPTTRREFLGAAAVAPAAPRRTRPNMLFFFPDQHRFDWTGLNPALDVYTPNLKSLAARGVWFRSAVVASPLCAPSRAALASGRDYDRCRVRNNGEDYPLDQPTFYQALREAGYHVAGCGKFDLHKKNPVWGLGGKAFLKEWGFSDGIDSAGKMDAITSGADKARDPYMAYLESRGLRLTHVADFRRRGGAAHYSDTAPTALDDQAYCDNWIAANGLKLLGGAPRGGPWFLMLNFTGPHSPMDITKSMERGLRSRTLPPPNHSTEFDPATHLAIRQNYTAMVENIDRWLGVFLDTLRQRGELDNTLVVYSSDHGDMLGDLNRWAKSLPYQPAIGVPLVAAGPGVERGIQSDALVSHIDLAATFLAAAGIGIPKEMDSRPLQPILAGRARAHREFVCSGLNKWRAVWDGRHKLVSGFGAGQPYLLFDHAADPAENTDVAAGRPEVVERLKKLLPTPDRSA
jgi:arylsulfatase A-like enzyme